jgi:hypothetical protein
VDKVWEMNLQGFITTDDGTLIMTDYRGYGRVHKDTGPQGRREVLGAAWHFAQDEKYRRLNDAVCAIAGEVRSPSVPPEKFKQAEVMLVFDVAEIVWEPPKE